jgi:hypothetical protein
MICPACKAEYRQEFTRCGDCDVQLVQALTDSLAVREDGRAADSEDDPFCEFWRGEDQRVRGELCDVLAEAGIPYRTLEWQDHLFNRMRFPAFRVAVPFSLFERAEKAVADAYGGVEEADKVMNPTEENREEFRKLLELPWQQKLREFE